MTDMTAEMHEARTASTENTAESTALDRCYRQIGISAVAAAARYQGVAKNPAYAPAPTKWQHDTDDAVA